jgi:phosphoribosyl-dephospho-CoA transferase
MLARHNLVWLTAAGWEAAGDARPGPEQSAMRQWRDNAWPAVARRAEGIAAGTGDTANTAWLALSLPPDPLNGNKPRVGFRVASCHVLRAAAPLRLNDALQAAPISWQPDLQALDTEATSMGLRFHAFGSLAWQAITGLQYLGPCSDIDLLWYPRSRDDLAAGLRLLSRYAAALPLDGEIIFPGGSGVAWKEWLRRDGESACTFASPSASSHESPDESAQGSAHESAHESAHGRASEFDTTVHTPRVLAKAAQSVRLVTRDDLIASLEEVACAG